PGDVGWILMISGNKVAALGFGNGGSGDLPFLGRRQAFLAGDRLHQLLSAGELAISNRTRFLRIGYFAVGNRQGRYGYLPALRCNLQEHLTRGCGHGAKLRAHGWSGTAPEGAHVPWR